MRFVGAGAIGPDERGPECTLRGRLDQQPGGVAVDERGTTREVTLLGSRARPSRPHERGEARSVERGAVVAQLLVRRLP
jgi:hypothetical protein